MKLRTKIAKALCWNEGHGVGHCYLAKVCKSPAKCNSWHTQCDAADIAIAVMSREAAKQ